MTVFFIQLFVTHEIRQKNNVLTNSFIWMFVYVPVCICSLKAQISICLFWSTSTSIAYCRWAPYKKRRDEKLTRENAEIGHEKYSNAREIRVLNVPLTGDLLPDVLRTGSRKRSFNFNCNYPTCNECIYYTTVCRWMRAMHFSCRNIIFNHKSKLDFN